MRALFLVTGAAVFVWGAPSFASAPASLSEDAAPAASIQETGVRLAEVGGNNFNNNNNNNNNNTIINNNRISGTTTNNKPRCEERGQGVVGAQTVSASRPPKKCKDKDEDDD